MKGKATAKETATAKQIRELNTEKLLKMDLGKFCVLRNRANAEERKRLEYIWERAQLEYTVRTIVREELAKLR